MSVGTRLGLKDGPALSVMFSRFLMEVRIGSFHQNFQTNFLFDN